MGKRFLAVLVTTMFLSTAVSANADPVRIGAALTGAGDGINSKWINTPSVAGGDLNSAIAALNLTPGSTGHNSEVNLVAVAIDFADYPSAPFPTTPQYTPAPYPEQDTFAVRYYGFLNVSQNDTYFFRAYTDDGVRLTIGGQQILEYTDATAARETIGQVFLTSGLYAFDMVSWDQGGGFINELAWKGGETSNYAVVGQEVLFTSANPVPEPATMILFGTGVAGLIAARRKKKAC